MQTSALKQSWLTLLLPEGHICPKSIDLTTFSLANKIYHIHFVVFFKDQVDVDVIPLRHYVTSRAIMT